MRERHKPPESSVGKKEVSPRIWEEERHSCPIKISLSGVNPQMQMAQTGKDPARAWVWVFFFFPSLFVKAERSQGWGGRLEPKLIPACQPVPCRAT